MTVYITLTTAGTSAGPFNLYSDIDGFTSAFETNISRATLIAGYASALVPDFTTTIRVLSLGLSCTNLIDIPVIDPTTTTTTTIAPTTTTTTTV